MEVMAALNIDPSAFDTTGSKDYLACAYRLLEELEPLYLKYRGSDRLKVFVKHGDTDYGTYLRFGSYNLTVSYAPKQTAKPLGAGIVIELDQDTFLITRTSCTISFQTKPGDPLKADILRLEEGTVVNGQWKRGRILNGDEKMSLKFGDMPEMKLVKLYRF